MSLFSRLRAAFSRPEPAAELPVLAAEPTERHRATCLTGMDEAATGNGRDRDGLPVVWVAVGNRNNSENVLLRPATARAFAAGILNAADAADGTTPLLYLPPSPDAEEPVR